MARAVDTEEVVTLVHDGALPLEVLPPSAYRREHLPGARNLPLPELTRDRADDLPRDRTIVVYCYDTECDLSARGAALLEAYGFEDVVDYRGSKTEWFGLGHPLEGDVGEDLRAVGVVRDVPTVTTDAVVGDLGEAFGDEDLLVVVDADQIVLGAVRRPALDLDPSTAVLSVLAPAPASVRPTIPLDELAPSMDDDGQDHVLVTLLDGRLVGIVHREDLTPDA